MYDLAIVGGGTAGASAATFTGRAGLQTVVIDGDKGMTRRAMLNNHLGFPEGITGPDLVDHGQQQAERAGATWVKADVTALESRDGGFALTTDVLIPRPETEVLVEEALARFRADARIRVLDLGTGSGNIAITLALERPDWMVTALDSSPAALAVARGNARSLGGGSIEWLQGDWYGPVAGRAFDLIVSNPPYVAQSDPHLHDLRFEPSAALSAGHDGLAAIRRIVAGAGAHLAPQGWLLFEHGFDQAQACASLLAQAGFTGLVHAPDLAGLPRVSGGCLP